MSLLKYKSKRNLKKSGEPKAVLRKFKDKKITRFSSEAIKKIALQTQKGKSKKTARLFLFVVHSHFAKQHHYDLRLQVNNVLKSWAVPKEPPIDEKTKRLAIQVEDHPLSYANFHGIIPEGNYGAGKVKIWDKGFYIPEKFSDKEIIINIHGKKLKGKYVLIKTNYSKKSWLWFKGKN